MYFRARHRGWVTNLSLLLTCALLITDAARTSAVDTLGLADGGSGGGGGGGEEVMERGGDGVGVVVAENGTEEAVVLDCPYHLDEEDLQGIHIKWYHPTSTAGPVYVWVPDGEPTALWILRDRVDLTYEASTDAMQRHRALRILEPTTDLAGRYVCQVSSFTVELRYIQDLIVFSEPRGVDVWVEEREEGQVGVICKVEEVYPQPVLYLYQRSIGEDSEVLSGGTPITSFSRSTYNMQMEKVVQEASLKGPTEFECHVTIPNTEVRFTTSTKYLPRVSATTGAVTGGSNTLQASLVVLATFSLLLCLPQA